MVDKSFYFGKIPEVCKNCEYLQTITMGDGKKGLSCIKGVLMMYKSQDKKDFGKEIWIIECDYKDRKPTEEEKKKEEKVLREIREGFVPVIDHI